MYVWADMIDWRFIQTARLKREWPSVRFISLSWLVFELHVASLIRTIVSCRLQVLLFNYISYLLRCPYAFFVPYGTTLILQSGCFCRARQVAWSLGGWILRHLRGCFVLILFKEPTFLVGTGSVSLLLLCDMIQRLYLFLSSLWYSQRQRQSCLPDHWLCKKAKQCQKRIAVCCHRTDVI